MGSEDGFYNVKPAHKINLDAFWMDRTEVTNAMYAGCVLDGGCAPLQSSKSNTHESYYGNAEFENYPVVYVDWNQAKSYCKWAGRRLPTEAEWEKAARGDAAGRIYPWGDAFDGAKLNFCDINCSNLITSKSSDDGYKDVSPVGNYPDGASLYGALDMAGNVMEWVSTLYAPYPYDANDGRERLGNGARSKRGGSFGSDSVYSRSYIRLWGDSTETNYVTGFRCATTP
jgi:serine/threonine-protein kinase